jgi:predicted Zn-dependent protease
MNVMSAVTRPAIFLLLSGLAIAGTGCSKVEDTREQQLARANNYWAAEQYDKAEQEYTQVIRRFGNDPVATSRLGVIHYDQGQLPQAYPLLKQAVELRPDDLDVKIKLGQSYLSNREFQQARDIAQEILEKQPGHEGALLLLVGTARSPEEVESTRQLVESLRAQDRDRPGYHLALGALIAIGNAQRRDQAKIEFKTAIEMDPKSANAHTALANLQWAEDDVKAADESFKAAAELSPLRSPERLRYADFKLRTGAIAEGKVLLEEINREHPDYLPPRALLMRIACQEKRDDNCTGRVKNILAQDPLNFDALIQTGFMSLAQGEAGQAVRIYEQPLPSG